MEKNDMTSWKGVPSGVILRYCTIQLYRGPSMFWKPNTPKHPAPNINF